MNLYSILNIFLFISLSVADTTPKCQHFRDTYQIEEDDCVENDKGEVTKLLVYYII